MSSDNFSTLTDISPVLTKETLSKALTDWYGDNITFTHWEYVSETGKGDSYLSEVIRIRIHGKNDDGVPKHVQVILKNIPKSISRLLTFRCNEFFKNEINFYRNVLPALLKFQSTKKVKEPFSNYVKVFYTYCDGVNDVICLEDATLESFGCAKRQEGIDLEHCKVSFKALAQFHAISFAMRDQQPNEFNKIRTEIVETYYAEHLWDWYGRFWHRICGIAIDAVEKEFPNSIYLKKIKEFAVPGHYKHMIEAVSNFENCVISHGDCWTNNFLYKYENSRAVDTKIIDFQLARCASPVLDIVFFIYACTTQELRLKHYDELLRYYYDVLSSQIKELGSEPEKVYSYEIYMSDVKKYSHFGLAFSFESTPFIVLAPEDAVNMEMEGDKKLNIDDVWQLSNFKTKEGRMREANNIVHCVDNGYI